MASADLTPWSVVLGAAAGEPQQREIFARRYEPVVRAYLASRWRVPREHPDVGDVTSDVFVECFKDGGVLERVDRGLEGGFQAYLYGVVRNVARMAERRWTQRRQRSAGPVSDLDVFEGDEATLSEVFDRAWARSLVGEARQLMHDRAAASSVTARRFRALQMRFDEGLPPRRIAEVMELRVESIYELLREGRSEFRATLMGLVADHHPGASQVEIERMFVDLLRGLA